MFDIFSLPDFKVSEDMIVPLFMRGSRFTGGAALAILFY